MSMTMRRIMSAALGVFYIMALLLLAGCGSDGKEANEKESTASSTIIDSGSNIYDGTTDFSDPNENKNDEKPVFTSEKERETVALSFEPEKYDKKVKPYSVKSDLSNVANLAQFGDFTNTQRNMLYRNGFVVTPSSEEQLFYIYETNQYLKLPSFITVDSVLQVYHVFFDYSLRSLEADKLLGAVEELTSSMLDKSIYVYNNVNNPQVKAAALKNIAYFAVAQMALEKELPDGIPADAKNLAETEYEKVAGHEGFSQSAIFPFELDYSQYVPRGHYTRSKDFERYFKAMMWYGQVPFKLYDVKDDGSKEIDVDSTVQALLITYCTFLNYNNTSDAELWERIYDPTTFYVGKADDLTIYNYKDLLVNVYGENPDINSLADTDRMTKLESEAEKLPEPQIQAKWITVNTPAGKQFRFMGQRYIPDSEILQELVEPYKRPMPSGLDIMGVLGSDRAYDLLINLYKVNKQWDGYIDVFKALKSKFSKLSDEKWRSNMYYGWLWTLKSLIEPFGEGYPSFMTNTAWKDKSLNTALGSWSELRHDTILYGKQSGAECGGGDEMPVIKSYVEPNVEAYERLLWLTRYSRENLTERQILSEDIKSRMQAFEDLLQFLKECSIKELRNEELTEEEYNTLLTYGGSLEYLTSSLVEGNLRWFEITSETDKNMANIADVHTVLGEYLEAGVGLASQIFVIVPIGSELYLTRGAVFSYNEFVSDKRLTDEEWQKMLKDNGQPLQPEWVNSFKAEEKAEIPDH